MKLAQINSVSDAQSFNVTAGALRVTDPCYDMATWCAGTLDKVRNGTWDAHVGYHKDALDMEMSAKWRQDHVEKMERAKALGNEALAAMHACDVAKYDKAAAEYLGRVAYIHIVAQGFERHFDHSTGLDATWQLADIDVGVDSGQAGFFDVAKYALSVADKDDSRSRRDSQDSTFESFYDSVCNLTLEDKQFGVVAFGTVSSSGYGDGSYDCYFRRNDVGEVIEAVIVYLQDYHEEDEELAA